MRNFFKLNRRQAKRLKSFSFWFSKKLQSFFSIFKNKGLKKNKGLNKINVFNLWVFKQKKVLVMLFLIVFSFSAVYYFGFGSDVKKADAAACTFTSNASGNWSGAIWTIVGTGCGAYPGQTFAGDTVVISNGHTVTLDVSPANPVASVSFATGNTATNLNFSGTNTLTISGALTLTAPGGNVTKSVAVGTGTLNVGDISITSGVNANRISQVTLSSGTITSTGNILFAGTASAARLTFTGAGTLNIGGANGMSAGGTFTASTGTVNYNGAGAQSLTGTYTYYNLTFSGSGNKTILANTTVSNNFSINATAVGYLTNGTSSTANAFYYGGAQQPVGSWGSTASAATNKNDTYFSSAATGIITAATGCTAGTHLLQLLDLVLHQGYERRHHDGQSVEQQGWNLIAQRFAAAGGHDHQGVAFCQQIGNDLFLQRAKAVIAEYAFQEALRCLRCRCHVSMQFWDLCSRCSHCIFMLQYSLQSETSQ